jgi:type III pantothenate kinase
MILAIDIGNAHTKIGFFRRKTLARSTTLPSVPPPTMQSIRRKLVPPRGGELEGAVISSVVPALTKRYAAAIQEKYGLQPLIVSGKMNVGIAIHYKHPSKLGPDRICAAVAAYKRFGGPVIIVDFGTATTYGVIMKNGEFLGGAISAGIRTSANALARGTAKLPAVSLSFPDHPVGKTTVRNIQSGILFGALDAVEGMVKRLKSIAGRGTTVIATGGFAKLVASRTNIFDAVVPDLVLEGAHLIYERTR